MRIIKKVAVSLMILTLLPHLVEVSFEPISDDVIALKNAQSND